MRKLMLLIAVFTTTIAAAQKFSTTNKLSDALVNKLTASNSSDSVDIVLTATDTAVRSAGRVLHTYHQSSLIRIPAATVKLLAENRGVQFIDLLLTPKEELTTGSLDLATNSVNLVHRIYPQINGEGITISFKENHFDTSDLDLLKRFVDTHLGSSAGTAHATIMATTAAGAGNTSPYGMGAAWKAKITSSNFINLLPDPDSVFQKYNISVQNHSYGTLIQSYYGAEARAYDLHAMSHPYLLHVFSSGNSGTATNTTGPYSTIATVSNLTGNFKWSKNTMAVGAIDSFFNVASLSSRGPAPDGRIKPELVAFGQDGSSGAAALVSGTAALLQQAYFSLNGKLPLSSLVKAVLVNSARDVGPVGIDFKSGFGSLDAFNAVRTVMESRVITDSVAASQTRSFPVTIPSNAAKLKVTIAWTDPAADINAPKALVNNLDLAVKDNGPTTWLPWILNKTPHTDSLNLPAIRGIDTLNNVEQVTIDAPAAGTYTIEVKALNLSTARQPFSIAYQVDTVNHFRWTFPTNIHPLLAGSVNIVRWETNRQGPGILEYSSNGGGWNQLATINDTRNGYYEWNVPDSFTTSVLRIRYGANEYLSDTFVTSQPVTVRTAFNCADSFMLYWDRKPVASYQVYALVDKYLVPVLPAADSFHVFSKTQFPSTYFAVAPLVNGKPGLRSNSLNYPAAGTSCYFRSFYLQSIAGKQANLFASIGTLYNVQSISLQKLTGGIQTITTINNPSLLDFSVVDPSMVNGVNIYRLQITLKNGQAVYSELLYVNYFGDEDVFVYPNPVKRDQLLHVASNKAGRQTLQIFNSMGMKVKDMKIKNNQQDVRFLKAGVYFLRFVDDEGNQTVKKVLVQ